jgi:hypothetical protein
MDVNDPGQQLGLGRGLSNLSDMNNDYFNLMVSGKVDKFVKGKDSNLELTHQITNLYGDDYNQRNNNKNSLTPVNYLSRLMGNPTLFK